MILLRSHISTPRTHRHHRIVVDARRRRSPVSAVAIFHAHERLPYAHSHQCSRVSSVRSSAPGPRTHTHIHDGDFPRMPVTTVIGCTQANIRDGVSSVGSCCWASAAHGSPGSTVVPPLSVRLPLGLGHTRTHPRRTCDSALCRCCHRLYTHRNTQNATVLHLLFVTVGSMPYTQARAP